jgi:inorganic pyrophosphatase
MTIDPIGSIAPGVNPVHGIAYKSPQGQYRMVVEIPAGTSEKWQTDPASGAFYHDEKDGAPRVINFLPYPMNYGFIPQTLLGKDKGGDGDPMDIITLAPARPRGTMDDIRLIGALQLSDHGEQDTKMVGLLKNGPFSDVQDIQDLLMRYPGTVEIIRLWFEGYKGAGSFLFQGYLNHYQATDLVELAHQEWKALQLG